MVTVVSLPPASSSWSRPESDIWGEAVTEEFGESEEERLNAENRSKEWMEALVKNKKDKIDH